MDKVEIFLVVLKMVYFPLQDLFCTNYDLEKHRKSHMGI